MAQVRGNLDGQKPISITVEIRRRPPYTASPCAVHDSSASRLQQALSGQSYIIIVKGSSEWGFVILRVVVVCILAMCAAVGAVSSSRVEPQADAGVRHIDLALKGDLTGDGRVFRVEWYHRDVLQAAAPGSYVAGVQVRGRADDSPVLAQWEAEKSTGVVGANPGFNDLWPVPESGGRLITVGVAYSGNTLGLTALRFDGNKLRAAGHWKDTGFTITRAGAAKRLVVIETVGIFGTNIPAVYAWNGSDFKEASREFPEYYASWAARYVKEIRNSEPMPADAVAADCQVAVKAFDYAGETQLARQACLDARKRITSGWALIPGQQGATPQDFDREKSAAIEAVNRTLAKFSKQEAARASGP